MFTVSDLGFKRYSYRSWKWQMVLGDKKDSRSIRSKWNTLYPRKKKKTITVFRFYKQVSWVYKKKKKITGIIGYDRLPTTHHVYVYTKNRQCDTMTSSVDDVYGIRTTRFSVKFDFTWQDVTRSSMSDPCVRADAHCNRVCSYRLKSSRKPYGYRMFETVVFPLCHTPATLRDFLLRFTTPKSAR